jgi:hypothetical protein
LAYHFGQAVPRWADEGGSVLSENEDEWFSHDIRCRELLNAGRGIKLRVLFTLKDYPKDMIVVYAQGYSICDYLINQHGGRQKFLQFVRLGMRNNNRNWEQAVQQSYGFESVDELEEKWIDALRTPPSRAAKVRPKGNEASGIALASRGGESRGPEIRTSSLGGVPRLEPPILARGAMADRDERSLRTVEAKPAVRPSDSPPPISLLLPPEYPSRK